MTDRALPTVLENILATGSEPDATFSALLPALGEVLQCDRIFLYLRNPHTKIGKITHCWLRSDRYPDVTAPAQFSTYSGSRLHRTHRRGDS